MRGRGWCANEMGGRTDGNTTEGLRCQCRFVFPNDDSFVARQLSHSFHHDVFELTKRPCLVLDASSGRPADENRSQEPPPSTPCWPWKEGTGTSAGGGTRSEHLVSELAKRCFVVLDASG